MEIIPVEIILGKNHRLFHADTINIKELENELFIDKAGRPTSKSHYLKGIINIPGENVIGVYYNDIRYELVSQGVGYAISRRPPDAICEQYGLRCIPLENVYSEVICVTNPTRPLNDTGKKFLTLLDEEIEKQKTSRFD